MDIPNLRGISRTAPYFMNNTAATLEEMLEHYKQFFKVCRSRTPAAPLLTTHRGRGHATPVIDRPFTDADGAAALLAYLRNTLSAAAIDHAAVSLSPGTALAYTTRNPQHPYWTGEPHALKGRTMSSREVRLLLVDDDPSAIQLMSRLLAWYPRSTLRHSGEVHCGIAPAKRSRPDRASMSDMPGHERARRLRSPQVPTLCWRMCR
jgi:hypothetical protein